MAYSREMLAQMAEAQDVFVWEAPAWDRHERGSNWYLWMSLVAMALAAYGVLTANYLFSFIIILIAIILILAGNEEPHRVLVQVGHNGIVVDGKLYLYDDLHSFSIIYHPPETKVMYIDHSRSLRPRLRIWLADEDPVAIRSHLKQYLTEDLDLQEEHFSDTLGRLLKL
jgi:hypothetical protein